MLHTSKLDPTNRHQIQKSRDPPRTMDRREAYYAAPSQIAQISDHCGPSKTDQRSDEHRHMCIIYIFM